MAQPKILVTGAGGQLGTVLTEALKNKHGKDAVVATDIKNISNYIGIFELLDVTDQIALTNIVSKHQVTQIYHMAAILSAKGEENPIQTWDINMKALFNVLEVSVKYKLNKVFFPSSIAVFGKSANKTDTKQYEYLDPTTVYGISKAAGENWVQYYHLKYGLDVRSIRYPGVIGYQSLPGGGTTDYAVEIYHKAIRKELFVCFLDRNTRLPMIYMDDAIRATLEIMEAPSGQINTRTSYNISGFAVTPEEIVNSIKKWYPEFNATYQPDFRQNIADSWPNSINDEQAQQDWNWRPNYLLNDVTKQMIEQLENK